jgi:hypothetical protein
VSLPTQYLEPCRFKLRLPVPVFLGKGRLDCLCRHIGGRNHRRCAIPVPCPRPDAASQGAALPHVSEERPRVSEGCQVAAEHFIAGVRWPSASVKPSSINTKPSSGCAGSHASKPMRAYRRTSAALPHPLHACGAASWKALISRSDSCRRKARYCGIGTGLQSAHAVLASVVLSLWRASARPNLVNHALSATGWSTSEN